MLFPAGTCLASRFGSPKVLEIDSIYFYFCGMQQIVSINNHIFISKHDL